LPAPDGAAITNSRPRRPVASLNVLHLNIELCFRPSAGVQWSAATPRKTLK